MTMQHIPNVVQIIETLLHRHCQMGGTATVAITLLLLVGQQSQAEITYATLALSGWQAPGAPAGVVYENFSRASFSDSDTITFQSDLDDPGVLFGVNDEAIFTADELGTALVVRSTESLPGFPGNVGFDGLGLYGIHANAAGTDFGAGLSGPGITGSNDEVILRKAGGALEVLAREGGQAPVIGVGAEFAVFHSIVSDNMGSSVLTATLSGVGVGLDNDRIIYSLGAGGTHVVAREGDSAPGAAPGSVFTNLNPTNARITDMGQIALLADYTGGTGIFTGGAENVQLAISSGSPAPNAPPGTTLVGFNHVGINNNGELGFLGFANGPGGPSQALYTTHMGLQQIAASGQSAAELSPVLSATYESFGSAIINGAGDMAFIATIDALGVSEYNHYTVYKSINGELDLISRQGLLIPDATDGARFGEPISLHFNDAGQVAFFSELQGNNINPLNDTAIFAEANGALRLIAREGDLFDVDPDPAIDDLRQISGISIAGTAGSQDGRQVAYNALGQLAFALSFVDGSVGVFLAETGIPGDFDDDGDVDGQDFLFWQRGDSPAPLSTSDLADWEANFGVADSLSTTYTSIPEPTGAVLLVTGIVLGRWRAYHILPRRCVERRMRRPN